MSPLRLCCGHQLRWPEPDRKNLVVALVWLSFSRRCWRSTLTAAEGSIELYADVFQSSNLCWTLRNNDLTKVNLNISFNQPITSNCYFLPKAKSIVGDAVNVVYFSFYSSSFFFRICVNLHFLLHLMVKVVCKKTKFNTSEDGMYVLKNIYAKIIIKRETNQKPMFAKGHCSVFGSVVPNELEDRLMEGTD